MYSESRTAAADVAAPGAAPRAGAKGVVVALAAAIGILLFPYVTGLLGAAVCYVVARPLVVRLEAARSRRFAALGAVVALLVILVVPGLWLFAELVGELPDAARSLQQTPAVQHLLRSRLGSIDVGSQLQRAGSEILSWGSRQTLGALGTILSTTINLVIALFGAYYLLVSGDRLWSRTRHLLPFPPATSEQLRRRFHHVTEAMLLGVVLTAVAQGALVALAFTLLRFEHALLWGALTAVASVLPMFGSAIVWLPAAAFLFAQQRVAAGVGLAAFGVLIVSNIDNALRLFVYRRVSHIHPMITLVGAFAGVNAFGIGGLLLGPLVLSYGIELASVFHGGPPVPGRSGSTADQGFPFPADSISPTPTVPQVR